MESQQSIPVSIPTIYTSHALIMVYLSQTGSREAVLLLVTQAGLQV
jgi:hypothetical protein